MSSVYLIAALVILLTAMVCYVFISQHLAKKRKQQLRVLTALKKRQQLFKYMASGFPPGFLPSDLNKLVYRVLLNTCEQLAKLDPSGGYSEEFQLYSKQAENQPLAGEKPKLPPEKTGEAKTLLQELQRYISSQAEKGRLPQPQAAGYLAQIRRLMLQIAIESYSQQAKKARSENKLRLAIHYYSLARKLLLKEASQQNVKKQVEQLSGIISKLEAEYAAQEAPPASVVEEEKATRKAWNEFEEEDSWKKKQIYD